MCSRGQHKFSLKHRIGNEYDSMWHRTQHNAQLNQLSCHSPHSTSHNPTHSTRTTQTLKPNKPALPFLSTSYTAKFFFKTPRRFHQWSLSPTQGPVSSPNRQSCRSSFQQPQKKKNVSQHPSSKKGSLILACEARKKKSHLLKPGSAPICGRIYKGPFA